MPGETTFDKVLNTVIPWLIAIIGIWILYRPLKEPLSGLFGGIKKLIDKFRGKEEESNHVTYPIQYPANLDFE